MRQEGILGPPDTGTHAPQRSPQQGEEGGGRVLSPPEVIQMTED